MTIPAAPRKAGPYVGTGALAQYSFNFPVTSASHLVVVEANADGFETTLTLTTDYTVALNPNQQTAPGGIVTRKAGPLPVDYRWTILSNVPFSQTVDLPPGGAFSAEVIESGLDNVVMQVQQLAEELGRAIKVGATESIAPNELLDAAFAAASAAQAAAASAEGSASAAAGSAAAAAAAAAAVMPAGTRMVFAQASAPTGWTQDTSVNDRVLRVVSGAGGGNGGSWTISGLSHQHNHWMDHVHESPVRAVSAGDGAFWQVGSLASPGFGIGNTRSGQQQRSVEPGATVSQSTALTSSASQQSTGGASITGVSSDGTWRPAFLDILVASKN